MSNTETPAPDVICKKCKGKCKPGKALMNHLCGTPDFSGGVMAGATLAPSSTAVLIDCMKCEGCGHSFRTGSQTEIQSK